MPRAAMVFVIALIVLASAGCGGQKQYSATYPRDVASHFMDLVEDNNIKDARALLSKESKAKVSEAVLSSDFKGLAGSQLDYQLGKAVINGDKADIPVELTLKKGETGEFTQPFMMKLVREGKTWKVDYINM